VSESTDEWSISAVEDFFNSERMSGGGASDGSDVW